MNTPIDTPSVCIVIVNYRTADLTIDCLRSLATERDDFPSFDVVIADNASPDGSVAQLTSAIKENDWEDWITLLPLERNGGFAYGNNEAIRRLVIARPVMPKYVHLLNPDTLVRFGAIKALVDFLERHPKAGIAGSRLENPDGSAQPSPFRFHSVVGELADGLRLGFISRLLSNYVVAPHPPQTETQADWVSGASLMIRTDVFRNVGLLDESYFMYYEETDFCLRAVHAGWERWYVPTSRIVHLQGQSSGVGQKQNRMPAYWFDSRRRYFVKNLGPVRAAAADFAWATSRALWRVRRTLQHKPDLDPPHLLGDFLRNSVFAKGFRVSSG